MIVLTRPAPPLQYFCDMRESDPAAATADVAMRHALDCWKEACGPLSKLIAPLYTLAIAAALAAAAVSAAPSLLAAAAASASIAAYVPQISIALAHAHHAAAAAAAADLFYSLLPAPKSLPKAGKIWPVMVRI